jgi:hypothetical protein
VFIVDTQVHIWKEETTPDRPWIPGARERMRLNGHREEALTYQECISLMDEAGVDRVLIVPPWPRRAPAARDDGGRGYAARRGAAGSRSSSLRARDAGLNGRVMQALK